MTGPGTAPILPVVGVALIGGGVPIDVELPPLALDEHEALLPCCLHDPCVHRHAVVVAVDDEIGGLRIDDRGVAVLAQNVIDSRAVDAELAVGEHPAMAVGERVGPPGDDQAPHIAIGNRPRRHRRAEPLDVDRCPPVGEHRHPQHVDRLSDPDVFQGCRPGLGKTLEDQRGRDHRPDGQEHASPPPPRRGTLQRPPPPPQSRQQRGGQGDRDDRGRRDQGDERDPNRHGGRLRVGGGVSAGPRYQPSFKILFNGPPAGNVLKKRLFLPYPASDTPPRGTRPAVGSDVIDPGSADDRCHRWRASTLRPPTILRQDARKQRSPAAEDRSPIGPTN